MPPPDISARRGRGLALIASAVLIVALVETGIRAYYWFSTLTGLTCLAAAAAGRPTTSNSSPGRHGARPRRRYRRPARSDSRTGSETPIALIENPRRLAAALR